MRILNLLLLTTALTLFFGCSPKKEVSELDIPAHIIPPDSMTMIIADLQYTEAILREHKRIGQDNEVRSAKYMKELFEKFQVSPTRYKQSIAFYEQNQDAYYQIYTDVVSLLSQKETELKEIEKAEIDGN